MRYYGVNQWFLSQSLASDFTSNPVKIGGLVWFGVEFAWTGADAVNGAIYLEGSITGANWCKFEGSDYTLETASGDKLYNVEPEGMQYARLVYVRNDNLAGTMSAVNAEVADRNGDFPGKLL